MNNFDLKKYLVENKLTVNSQILEGDNEEATFDAAFLQAANDIAKALESELQKENPDQLDEALVSSIIAGVLTSNAIVGFVSKYSAKLFKLLNWKKGEDIAEKIHHWAHDNEVAFQTPIKRVLKLFVKDPKTLDLLTKGIYAIVVGSMAANYGVKALDSLSNADWFNGALGSLKTLAKGEETILNAYPSIKDLVLESKIISNSQQLNELNLKPIVAATALALSPLGSPAQIDQSPKSSVTQQMNTPESIREEWSKNLTDTQAFGEGKSPDWNFAKQLAYTQALSSLSKKTQSSKSSSSGVQSSQSRFRNVNIVKEIQFENPDGTYIAFIVIDVQN